MIQIDKLFKHYDNGLVEALKGISLDVRKGEIVAVMGPSGCGKSTLLSLIGALDVSSAGEIFIEGRNIRDYKPLDRFRAAMIGFVFQFYHLIPSITLLENVEIPMHALPLSRKERKKRAEIVLTEMGLAGRMHFLPTRVSGGERQRAAIARAVVNEPRIILADEPTGNLDSETGGMILDVIISRCRQKEATMLLATHDPEVAARADRIIRLRDGLLEGLPVLRA
jgi:putative ABC transport system ATP-binding protein